MQAFLGGMVLQLEDPSKAAEVCGLCADECQQATTEAYQRLYIMPAITTVVALAPELRGALLQTDLNSLLQRGLFWVLQQHLRA